MLVMLMQIMQLPPGSQDIVQGVVVILVLALAGKVAIRTGISRSDGATTVSIRSAIPRTIFKDLHRVGRTPIFLRARGDLATNPLVSGWQLRQRATTLEHTVDLSVCCR